MVERLRQILEVIYEKTDLLLFGIVLAFWSILLCGGLIWILNLRSSRADTNFIVFPLTPSQQGRYLAMVFGQSWLHRGKPTAWILYLLRFSNIAAVIFLVVWFAANVSHQIDRVSQAQ